MKNSLGKNAAYKLVLNIFNLLVPLFVGPYIAGLISPEFYGVYNRVYAEFQIFLIIGTFGIYNYGVREISKVRNDKEKFGSILTSLFVIGVIANIIVTIVYIIYFVKRGSGIDQYIYATMIIQLVSNIFYIEFVNEAVENYAFIAKKTILIRILYFAAIFLLVKKPSDVIIYSLVVSTTVFVNNFVSFVYLKRQYRFKLGQVKIARHIFPLIVTLLLTNVELLYGQLDKVMLSPFVNDIAVTEYTLPTTLIGMLGTLPLALITVAIPRLAKYVGEKDKVGYHNTLDNTIRSYMAILIPMSFGVMILSKEIMWLYTRNTYTYAYPVLICAALARIVFGYQSIVTHLVMYVNGLEKQLTILLFGGGILNLILNFILVFIGYFTPLTALLTTMISSLVFVVLATTYSQKKLGVRCSFFSKGIRGYYFVSILFIPISMIVKTMKISYWTSIFIQVPICILIYGLYLFKKRDPLVSLVLEKIKKR